MPEKTYTLTAALPYANGPIHIGHVAGVYLPADIYARYQRKKKNEVAFICGSDEGGIAITLAAKKLRITPQDLVNKYHAINQKALYDFGISFDIFSRTSSPRHHQIARDFFLTLHEKGVLEWHEREAYYDEKEKIFLADRYIQGICPKCSYESAYGDQCEQCGCTLSPDELIAPNSTLTGTRPVKRKTGHWYMPLSRYEYWLRDWILKDGKRWKSNVYGQCKSWLDQGLVSRAITRDLDWGVAVPLEEAKGKALYVWFEAPIGYISATQIWAEAHDKDWKRFWKDPKTKLIHFAGKDNIVFHCIIFPAMLKAHEGYILPESVPANEFMNLEGQKISTSRGHAIWLHEYLAKYTDQQDVLRYMLCACMPETKDSDFTWQVFKERNNHELVATLGNFVHRTLTLVHKYFEGKVPHRGVLQSVDERILVQIEKIDGQIGEAIEGFRFREALSVWMQLAHMGNKYLAEMMPWKSFKEDRVRTGTTLYIATQLIGYIASFGSPFLPFTCEKINGMLNIFNQGKGFGYDGELVPAGHGLDKPVLLFRKLEGDV
ncbi:MAG: methionine--tRNA ligase [Bacteroidota bacterium]